MDGQNDGSDWEWDMGNDFADPAPPPIPVPPPIPPAVRPVAEPRTVYATPRVPDGHAPGRKGINLSGLSFALGALGILSSFFVIGGFLGLVGIVLGLRGIFTFQGKRIWAVLGIGLSAVAVLLTAGQMLLMVSMFRGLDLLPSMKEAMGSGGFNEWVGVQAPSFEAAALNGKTVKLSDYAGRRLAIHVFDDWNDSAMQGAEQLKRLLEEHPDTAVLAMSSAQAEKLKGLNTLAACPYPTICAREMDEPYRRFSHGEVLLFIDRKGVIQKVMFNALRYKEMAESATASDYEGPVHPIPAGVLTNAKDAPKLLQLEKLWSRPVEGVKNTITGDWNGDGIDEIIVLGAYKVECIDAAGNTVGEWTPPLTTEAIQFGKCGNERRILARAHDGIYVYTTEGKFLWSSSSSSGDRVHDCCFVDVNGEGCDSVLAGKGDFSDRLVLFAADGKEKWSVSGSMLASFKNQAATRTSQGKVYLLTTQMMGPIYGYSATGKKVLSIGSVFSSASDVAVSEVDGKGNVQIVSWSDDGYVMATDGAGTALWRCTARTREDGTREGQLAAGDWDGDGVKEWSVPGAHEILIVSASGKILCHTGIFNAAPAFLNRADSTGLFVAGGDNEITAYAPASS